MRQTIRISVLLTIILLSIHTTESFVRIQIGPFPPIAWNLEAVINFKRVLPQRSLTSR
jgi:hypothetical protein